MEIDIENLSFKSPKTMFNYDFLFQNDKTFLKNYLS